jgi:hypothetical protein
VTGKRRAARLAGFGIGWLFVVALERLVAATEPEVAAP